MIVFNVTKENLIISAFLLLILDRVGVLFVIKLKGLRALRKAPGQGGRRRVPSQMLEALDQEFVFMIACLAVLTLLVLCEMQTLQPELLVNDVGRLVFAGIGFVLSVTGTAMNVCLEMLDKG